MRWRVLRNLLLSLCMSSPSSDGSPSCTLADVNGAIFTALLTFIRNMPASERYVDLIAAALAATIVVRDHGPPNLGTAVPMWRGCIVLLMCQMYRQLF